LIIITHDPNIADQTRRIIRLRDGELESSGDGNGGAAK
jgi:predicted ABC-type transport system involved in lysophospholipase L1 biosynthesis ATPase subunit